MKNEEKTAVVLLSGGMDSSTVLAIAKEEGYDCHTLAFDYGQRHRLELAMAERQARSFGVADHRVIRIDLRLLGGSALTDENIAIPAGELASGIPATYVPARNAIFLSLGLAFAEVLGACEIFIGVNQVDFSGYPDCREGFLLAFEKMANMATRAGAEGGTVRVRAPLLHLGKAEIIRRGIELGVDFGNTHTCYDPDPEGRACGSCPSCRLRLRGFAEAGVPDPITYRR